MIWGISHAFIYGFIVTQACFLPWYSDSFLERSLTGSGLPKFLGFPSLSTVPYRDFYRRLYVCWLFSRVRLFAIPWTVAQQAALSVDFSRQEYWSGLPFPSPGDLSHPGIEPRSSTLQADSLPLTHQGSPFTQMKLQQNCCSRRIDIEKTTSFNQNFTWNSNVYPIILFKSTSNSNQNDRAFRFPTHLGLTAFRLCAALHKWKRAACKKSSFV